MTHNIILTSNWDIFIAWSTFTSAAVSFFYTLFTFQLLKRTSTTVAHNEKFNEFQTLVELKKGLENAIANKILSIIDQQSFEIIPNRDYSTSAELNQNSNQIQRQQIKEYVLNRLDDIAFCHLHSGLISFKAIDSEFGFKILRILKSSKIRDFINEIRTEEKSPEIYGNLQNLHNMIFNNLTDSERVDFKIW